MSFSEGIAIWGWALGGGGRTMVVLGARPCNIGVGKYAFVLAAKANKIPRIGVYVKKR
jgi:hypothetical protein